MPGIGIRNLVNRGTDYAIEFIDKFIASSQNIKNSIKIYKIDVDEEEDRSNRRNVIIALIRDTYVCNLLLGYTGMMRLITDDIRYEDIDSNLLKYVDDFYDDGEFTKSLCLIYSRFRKECDDSECYENIEFTRFLERIIDRLHICDKKAAINSSMRMLESKIYNLLNVTPSISIESKYIKHIQENKENNLDIMDHKSFKDGKEMVEIFLHYENYSTLIDNVNSLEVRHSIENKYISRTHSSMKDFADLIIYRNSFAKEMGYSSFFQYVTRDKKDNSDAIKKLIVSLDAQINDQFREEQLRVYNYYNRHNQQSQLNRHKITHGDMQRYIKIHSQSRTYDKYVVIYYLFKLIEKYFGISIRRYDFDDAHVDVDAHKGNKDDNNNIDFKMKNFKGFELFISNLDGDVLLGRLYIDLDKSDGSKKIIDPISIKVSDRMLISDNVYTIAEVVLLGNYDKEITYPQIVQLFKEFGYIIQEICYLSGVGLVNRDPEFSNFMPLLMENIAWDKDTVQMICNDPDVTDHIIAMRHFDICTSLKYKCINAKFDHLIHNSNEIIDILVKMLKNPNNDTKEHVTNSMRNTIVQLYQTIYREAFKGVEDIVDMSSAMSLESIDPLTVVQEINGSQSLLYSNLINEIFAYTSYHIIKNNIKTNHEFRYQVLEDAITPFKDLISRFMNVAGINSFNLYLSQLLNIPDNSNNANNTEEIDKSYAITQSQDQESDNVCDYINTDYESNYNNFDDKPCFDEDMDNDEGSIIRINRI
jgi:hypothetical protein